ncbi:sialate O-acetylesterase [Termitidicoccus mucosus]|uniref:Sialate O-acetylesterase domain-containing protein n=1 Tax=Termitidicoccus mucosus TaxID=1184151 RepID=A0A178IEZ0_9BACT|nr:hypothetical protein AW736_17110 [Opitutaceae bacterium TSB47]
MIRIQLSTTHRLFRPLALAAALIAGILRVSALTLAPLLGDGVVLQRDMAVPIRGAAEPGGQVTVVFHGQTKNTKAGPGGGWLVWLDPMPADAKPAELTVTSGGKTVRVRDVLVGEVWLCSGQSNMELRVPRVDNAATEIAAANHPLIRHVKIARATAPRPATDAEGAWEVCSPETVPNFSATAYFFGRELHRRLDVPVGLIHSSWGGTQIESWMSADALRSSPFWPAIQARWQERLDEYPARLAAYKKAKEKWERESAAAKKENRAPATKAPRAPEGDGSRWMPAALYNGMIHPLLPLAVRGVIWYQGETNAARPDEYADLFPRMIGQWREDFALGRMPFYFVQLANLTRKSDSTGQLWALQREAQMAGLRQSDTGAAITIDIGNSNDIHPGNKQEAGRRLALIALAQTYGQGGEYSGPVFERVERDGNRLRVFFSHAKGLNARLPGLPGFEIAGRDNTWHPAQVRIDGETVWLSSDAVPEPVHARYAWHNDPPSSLYNEAGLPASPFRSERPPAVAAP